MIAGLMALALGAAGPADADTKAWWQTTATLSNDAMNGRDTGSADYERAARIVADRFAAAGLEPAGEDGSWFQRVPMEQLAVTGATILAGTTPLAFLYDIMLAPAPGMAERLVAPIAYRGYCRPADLGNVRGKVVICHGTHRTGLPSEAERQAAVKAAGAAAIVMIADPGFAVEPPRWPFAYARTVWLAGSAPAAEPMLRFTLNADALGKLIGGGGHDPAALIAAGAAGQPLPSFDAAQPLRVSVALERKAISAPNVLALLPGRDKTKHNQAIILSAHLDGYGPGEPVNGDGLYNGTLDDAAYVALLIRTAERAHEKGYKRPVIFAAFTGEEKGLLGARWFVGHPTLPKAYIAADINLDQLRPIFPLDLLTVHGLDDTTLGADARAVAGGMGVAVQRDPEPERNLLRRADNWPFMQAGIPATGFVFGYRPGSESERIYRQWYRTGYHRPQDDLAQPMDWKAAADFNRFFYALVERVADQDAAPAWVAGSGLKPTP
ncbi:M28 family peptidase [Sphingomonas nostoxanthinifaciens]|uniref:M28 family peptidase n=1 Tax=Sphingomonas nostoxanthinifaciens TaxID=2872652 RepID=UPI001CC1EC16|nr:M28 family peptidase [Sphingomonas nostoxanthinifaciens]UAK25387.1 M28 family peptidase [Sphingomonas nostoxanthinifaciens]